MINLRKISDIRDLIIPNVGYSCLFFNEKDEIKICVRLTEEEYKIYDVDPNLVEEKDYLRPIDDIVDSMTEMEGDNHYPKHYRVFSKDDFSIYERMSIERNGEYFYYWNQHYVGDISGRCQYNKIFGSWLLLLDGSWSIINEDIGHIIRTDNPHRVTKEQVGLGAVINAIQVNKSDFDVHALNNDNPHHVTKLDIDELRDIDNIDHASEQDFLKHTKDKFAHKLTKDQIGLDQIKNMIHAGEEDLIIHSIDYNNPHNVTKVTVGLSNVINEKQATTQELNYHSLNSDNPHHVTKSDVGLDKVLNIRQASKLSFLNHIGKMFNIHIVTLADVGLDKVTNEKQAVPENLVEHIRIKKGFTDSSIATDKLDHGFSKASIGLDNVKNIIHVSEDAYNKHMFIVAEDGTITTNKNSDHKVTVNQIKLEKLIDSKTGQVIESIVDHKRLEEHLLANNPHEVVVSESQLSELLDIENEKHLSKEEFEEHIKDDKAHQISSYNVGLGNVINMEQLTSPDFNAHISKKGREAAEMHQVTKATLGMSSADNTADIDKPLSRLQLDAISNNGCPVKMTDQSSSIVDYPIESEGFISGIFHDYDNHGSLSYMGDFDGEKILSDKQFLNLKTLSELGGSVNNNYEEVSKNNSGKYNLATGWYFIYTGDKPLEYWGYSYRNGDYIVYNHEEGKFYVTKNSKFVDRNDASNISIQKKNLSTSTIREYKLNDFLNVDPITLGHDTSNRKNAFDIFASLWSFKYNGKLGDGVGRTNLYLSPYQYLMPSRHISATYNGLFSQDVVHRYESVRSDMKVNSTKLEKLENDSFDLSHNYYYNCLFGNQFINSLNYPDVVENQKLDKNPYKIKSFSNGKHVCYSDMDTAGVIFDEKNCKVTSMDISPFSLVKDIISHDGYSEMFPYHSTTDGNHDIYPESYSSFFVGIPKKGFGSILFYEPSEYEPIGQKNQRFAYSIEQCGYECDGEIDFYWKTQIVKSFSTNSNPESPDNLRLMSYLESCNQTGNSKTLKISNRVYFIIHKSKEEGVNGIYCISGFNNITKSADLPVGVKVRFVQRNAAEIKKYSGNNDMVSGIYIDPSYLGGNPNEFRSLAECLNNTLTICTEKEDGTFDSLYIFNEMLNSSMVKLNGGSPSGNSQFYETSEFISRYGSALKPSDFSDHLISVFVYTLNGGRYSNNICGVTHNYSTEDIICTCIVDKLGKRVTNRALRAAVISNRMQWTEHVIDNNTNTDDTLANITTKIETNNDNYDKHMDELKSIHMFVNYEDRSQTNQFVYGVADYKAKVDYQFNNNSAVRIGFNAFHYASCGLHSQSYNNVKTFYQQDCGFYVKAIGNNYYRNSVLATDIYTSRDTLNNTYGSESAIISMYDEDTSRRPTYFNMRARSIQDQQPGYGSNVFNGQPYETKGDHIIYEKGNFLDLIHPVLCYKIYSNAKTTYPRFTEVMKYCNGNFLTINRCNSDGKVGYWANTVIDGKPLTFNFIPGMNENITENKEFSIDNIRLAAVSCSNKFNTNTMSIYPSYNILIITDTGKVILPESTSEQHMRKEDNLTKNNLTNFKSEWHNRSCAFIKNFRYTYHQGISDFMTNKSCVIVDTSDTTFGMKPVMSNIFNNRYVQSYTIPVVVDKILSKGYRKKINDSDNPDSDILNIADVLMKQSHNPGYEASIGEKTKFERCDVIVINRDVTLTITDQYVYINDQMLNININGFAVGTGDKDAIPFNGTKILNYLVVGNLLILLNFNDVFSNIETGEVVRRHSVCVVKLIDYFNFITSQVEMKSKIVLTDSYTNLGFINEIKFIDSHELISDGNKLRYDGGDYSMFLLNAESRETNNNSFIYSIGFAKDKLGHYFKVNIDNMGNIKERERLGDLPMESKVNFVNYANFKPFNIGNLTYFGMSVQPDNSIIGCYHGNGIINKPIIINAESLKFQPYYENNEEIYDIISKFFNSSYDYSRRPFMLKELRDGYLLIVPCGYPYIHTINAQSGGSLLYVPKRSIDQQYHQSRNYYNIDFNGQ